MTPPTHKGHSDAKLQVNNNILFSHKKFDNRFYYLDLLHNHGTLHTVCWPFPECRPSLCKQCSEPHTHHDQSTAANCRVSKTSNNIQWHHCTYSALLEKSNVRGVPLIERFLLWLLPRTLVFSNRALEWTV